MTLDIGWAKRCTAGCGKLGLQGEVPQSVPIVIDNQSGIDGSVEGDIVRGAGSAGVGRNGSPVQGKSGKRKDKEGKRGGRRSRRGTRKDETAEGEDSVDHPKAPRLPKRQCALLIGFCGSGYSGMQMCANGLNSNYMTKSRL